jgi:C4-dicarboxylate-specific signal transduction histidine kinase
MTEIQALFGALHASVLMPFVVGNRLIGFAALGKRMNLRNYKHDEIQYLTQLTGPMSIALSNSKQFEKVQQMSEELQRWNRELEDRVEKRTRELRETQEQLIQAEKMATLGILAGGVAHEINNPLTAVLTNAQILKMDAKPEDKESLDMIEEGAKRCQIIVQKLLNYSRSAALETGNQKTDLNRAVKSTIAMLGYQFKQDNVEISFESEDLPLIAAVQNEIEQVFTNLFVNAKDAIKRKSEPRGKIEVRSFKRNGKACVEVRDNGCGIPKEIFGKIFDPFFTTKDVGEGTGLGLSVTHGIVKRYQGEIAVHSEPGKGTLFTLSFAVA